MGPSNDTMVSSWHMPPPELLCPISQSLMLHPVTLTSGMTYDRASIVRWFEECGKPLCPLTRQTVDACRMPTNARLQQAIQAWIEAHADDLSIALQDQPLQVGSGHFLVPAYRPAPWEPSRTFDHDALRSLLRSLVLHNDHHSKVASLRAMLDVAIASAEGRLALYRAGAVKEIVKLLLSDMSDSEMDVKWYSAEVLSYVALHIAARDAVLPALTSALPWLQRKIRKRDPENIVHSLIKRLNSNNAQLVQLAAWLLWLLSLRPVWRQVMVKTAMFSAVQQLLSDYCRKCSRTAKAAPQQCNTPRVYHVVNNAAFDIDSFVQPAGMWGDLPTHTPMSHVHHPTRSSSLLASVKSKLASSASCKPSWTSITLPIKAMPGTPHAHTIGAARGATTSGASHMPTASDSVSSSTNGLFTCRGPIDCVGAQAGAGPWDCAAGCSDGDEGGSDVAGGLGGRKGMGLVQRACPRCGGAGGGASLGCVAAACRLLRSLSMAEEATCFLSGNGTAVSLLHVMQRCDDAAVVFGWGVGKGDVAMPGASVPPEDIACTAAATALCNLLLLRLQQCDAICLQSIQPLLRQLTRLLKHEDGLVQRSAVRLIKAINMNEAWLPQLQGSHAVVQLVELCHAGNDKCLDEVVATLGSVCAAATSDTTKATLADVGLVRRAVSLLAIHRPAHSSTKVRQGAAQILECLAVPCTVAHFLGDVCVSVPTMNVHGETMVQQRRVNVLDVALQLLADNSERRQLSAVRVTLCVLQNDPPTAAGFALCDPAMLAGLIRLLGSRYLHARTAAAALLHKAAAVQHNRPALAKAGCIPALVDVLQTPTILRGNELREATGVRQDAQEAEGALHQLAKSLRGEILTTCRMEQQTRPNSAELDRFLSTLQA